MDLYLDEIGEDFILVDEEKQGAEQLVKSGKGSWYQFRELGLNMTNELNGSLSKVKLQKRIKEQLKLANITAVSTIEFEENILKIYIDAEN